MSDNPEAIHRCAPGMAGTNDLNAARQTALAAGVASGAAVPGPSNAQIGNARGLGKRWMTFIWIPIVADQLVRLAWGDANVVAAATSRAFMAGVEYDYEVPNDYTNFSGLSAGGGELSWHVSNR